MTKWRDKAKSFMDNAENLRGTCFQCARKLYNDYQVYGKHYLWLLYVSEIGESIAQLFNTFELYLCSLPVGWSSFILIVLGIDCFHTVGFMVGENNVKRRDRQVVIDTGMNILHCRALGYVLWIRRADTHR